MSFSDLIKTISTEDVANSIPCPIRIQFLAGCAITLIAMSVFVGLAIVTVTHQKTAFDYTAFGTGFAALLAGFGTYVSGTGVALFMNAKSPDSKPAA